MDLDDLVGSVEPAAKVTARKPRRVADADRKIRAKHIPTDKDRQDVSAWVCAGIPHKAMADVLRIDEATLRRCYPTELENGTGIANSRVVGGLMQQVLNGNVTAMIFWCKTRLGWREKAPEDQQVLVKLDGTPVDAKALAKELRDAMIESQRTPPLPPAHVIAKERERHAVQ
jgi:hypothetical protein